MAQGLAPIPNLPVGDSHEWREWFFNLWQSLGGTSGTILYTDLNFAGSNITSILTRAHNTLQGLQGGNVGGTEYYHLDATQYTTLTALSLPLSIANGGTAATTQAGARTNLGVTATGSDTTYAFRANNLSDLASAPTARTNLGLGTMATENIGITATITTAALTPAGTQGSMTFTNGILTAQTQAT